MKRILLLTITCFMFSMPMSVGVSHAAKSKVCKKGNSVDQKCRDHMYNIRVIGKKLVACFEKLDNEYEGNPDDYGDPTTVPGKGSKFADLRLECIALATQARNGIKKAYKPGGDTSPRKALEHRIKLWATDPNKTSN